MTAIVGCNLHSRLWSVDSAVRALRMLLPNMRNNHCRDGRLGQLKSDGFSTFRRRQTLPGSRGPFVNLCESLWLLSVVRISSYNKADPLAGQILIQYIIVDSIKITISVLNGSRWVGTLIHVGRQTVLSVWVIIIVQNKMKWLACLIHISFHFG
jgi:hypothetical protein